MNLTVNCTIEKRKELFYKNYIDAISKKFKEVADKELLAMGINNIQYYERCILYFIDT